MKRLTWGIVAPELEGRSREEAAQLIQAVYPLPLTYDTERRNCMEFAEMLRFKVWESSGWRGVGVICDYDGYHCYNSALLIGDNNMPEFAIVEPQTGGFVDPGTAIRPGSAERYDLKRGWMLL